MKIKEKIKKSFAHCKRKQMLSYSEWLEKYNFEDNIYSMHEYEKYKIEIIDYNKTADLNISSKIGSFIFAVILVAVLVVLLVQQCSATVYYGWSAYDIDITVSPSDYMFSEYLPSDTTTYYSMYQDYSCYSIQDYEYYITFYPITIMGETGMMKYAFACNDIEQFQRFLSYNNITTYSAFVSWVDFYDGNINSGNTQPPLCGYYITETTFNEMKNFTRYNVNDLQNAYNNGCEDSFDTVSNWLQSYVTSYEPYAYVSLQSFVDTLNDNIGRQMTLVAQLNYQDGYDNAIDSYLNSEEFREYIDNEKANSYALGYAKGEESAPLVESSLRSIFNAPINFISNILNFEMFGVNLWGVFTFILTLGLLFFVIKKVVGL